MKTIYRVESPTGEVRVLEVSRNETGYNVYIDDSNICESITEEELTEALENPNFLNMNQSFPFWKQLITE